MKFVLQLFPAAHAYASLLVQAPKLGTVPVTFLHQGIEKTVVFTSTVNTLQVDPRGQTVPKGVQVGIH